MGAGEGKRIKHESVQESLEREQNLLTEERDLYQCTQINEKYVLFCIMMYLVHKNLSWNIRTHQLTSYSFLDIDFCSLSICLCSHGKDVHLVKLLMKVIYREYTPFQTYHFYPCCFSKQGLQVLVYPLQYSDGCPYPRLPFDLCVCLDCSIPAEHRDHAS